MKFDADLLESAGLDIDTGINYTGNKEKYISAIQRFYKSFDKNCEKIRKFYSEKDLENYSITVHALKSNAKMIGAMDLSTAFEDLEMAAKNNDIAFINANTESTLSSYARLREKLSPLGEAPKAEPEGELSGAEAKEVANELLAALDDFDDELSGKLVEKLAGYPFAPTQSSKLRMASDHIRDFMYDDAAILINEIYPSIEE